MNVMRYTLATIFITLSALGALVGQIIEGQDTLYGNEWIDYEQSYFKIKIAEDGIYRIPYEVLIQAGIPADEIELDAYTIYWMGKRQKIFVSGSSSTLGTGDFLAFYGEKNRSQLDRHLFTDPDEQMLNPEYSLHTDTAVYFLTWSAGPHPRFDPIENDLSGNLPNAHPWYLHRELLSFHDRHFKPLVSSQGVRLSTYVEGEGFATAEGTQHEFSVPVSALAAGGPPATLRFRLTGNTQVHNVTVNWNNQPISNLVFAGSNHLGGAPLIDTVLEVVPQLGDNTWVASSSSGTDRISIGTIELQYPRAFQFAGQSSFAIDLADARDRQYLELSGLNPSENYFAYDLNGGFRIPLAFAGNTARLLLPAGPNDRRILISSAASIQFINTLHNASLEPLDQSSAQYLLISNQRLFDDGSGTNWVQEYATYRQSEIGGSYQTQIIEIQQLVDQFAYGVAMHPFSIKNFSNYIAKNWSDPQFIFLVGKGLEYAEARTHQETYEYLPVYGIPGSDNILTSRHQSSVPLVPVGRLAARTPTQISIYLDKIKVMEDQIANAPQTIEDRAWMKRVLHLSAGDGSAEQDLIRRNMDGMAEIAEGRHFGAEISTLQLQASTDVIDGSVSENTLDLINSGIVLKSYFGHGGISTTQLQGFEDPFFLNNKDRYPVMLALGCHTGNIFTRTISLGESNVLTPDKGGVAYLATSGLGFLNALDEFGNDWYSTWARDLYGGSLGNSIVEVVKKHDAKTLISIKTLVQQLTFHGDPAWQFNASNQTPDLVIDASTVRTEPEAIDLQVDSFSLLFDIINLGKVIPDSFIIAVQHKTPSGDALPIIRVQQALNVGGKRVVVKIPISNDQSLLGTNNLTVKIDAEDEIEELPDAAEENNELTSSDGRIGFDFVIFDSAIRPLHPPKFGISNRRDLQLIASSTNPLAAAAAYQIQLDTTALFNSPTLINETLQNQFALVKWPVPFALEDDRVYYWRVRSVGEGTDTIWQSSSFLFKEDIEHGWNQSHYYQFLENDLRLYPIGGDRKFSFPLRYRDLLIKNRASRSSGTGGNGFVNGQRWSDFFRWEVTEGLSFVVFDSSQQSGFLTNFEPGLFGSINEKASKIAAFPFHTETSADRNKIVNFVENVIPDGAEVIVYTVQDMPNRDLSIIDWDKDNLTLFSLLEKYGASQIRLLRDEVRPYIFHFRKGAGAVNEVIAPSASDATELAARVPLLQEHGKLTSSIIGPARNWHQALWDHDAIELNDTSSLSILGLDERNMAPTLINESLESPLDLSGTQFPFLQLVYSASDVIEKSAPQIGFLRVTYEALPDITFNLEGKSVFKKDTLDAGSNQLELYLQVENLTAKPMDSVLVKYTISNAEVKIEQLRRYQSIEPFGIMEINEQLNIDVSEAFEFRAELNPDGDQPELYHFNNFLVRNANISSDRIDPILNVTFDGRQIFDEDIVSSTPLIKISLKDENTSILVTDSSTFRILLRDPDGASSEITALQSDVVFRPATNENNIASIEWQPIFSVGGIYELSIQGKDQSGNRSGEISKIIRFEVVLESTVSSISNFPNPFVTSTRFVYTLTGSVIPPEYIIRIYNVSGRVVRELSQIELGPLSVGHNLTEGSWDGTDLHGDRLANGTYLYRLELIGADNEFEHRNTKLDAFESRGFSKLVIIK